ncbi:hypothetical protein QJS04_geneDACA022584 [Acorus gramineus]|uniref:Uncharacterized protein n=1 Tax=Acorus gramineus TaxID=55184 RepID=A0AAV8ZXD9_ACOGR|nr:hypothetical protein QJS04_geneDACA022584 [Acorus gramineus]
MPTITFKNTRKIIQGGKENSPREGERKGGVGAHKHTHTHFIIQHTNSSNPPPLHILG